MKSPSRRSRSLAVAAPSYLALGCIAFAAAPAMAQDANSSAPEKSLGGVTVTDTAINEGGYKTEKPDSPKYTATLVNTPRSVTVIPSTLIRDTASASLTDALRTVPGVTFGAGEGGNPMGDRPFIRGFDSQASTYLDGVRDIGAQSRDVFAVEQIEVVKGSDSSMGGRGSAGGSLNLVSKAPTSDRFVAASGSIGNADYKRATLDINQPINDLIGVRVAGMWHDQDVAGRDAIWSKRWGVAPSIKIGLNGPTSLTIGYYHLESDELPDSGIPYLYTTGNAPAGVTETSPAEKFTAKNGVSVNRPRDAFYGLKSRDFRKNNVNNLTLRAQHEFDSGITLRNTSRYGRTTQGYIWTQPDDQQGNVYGTGQAWRRINSRYSYSEGLINQTDLFGETTLAGLKHSFSASLEFAWENAANGNYVSNALSGTGFATGTSATGGRCGPASVSRYNCTSIGSPNPNDPWVSYASDAAGALTSSIERSLPKTWTKTTATSWGVSLFDTITITENLLLNLGGRYDHYKQQVSPGLTATSTNVARTSVERTDDLWNYQAGLIFKPTSSSSIYVSTSSSATPPGSYMSQGLEGNAINTGSQILTDALKIERTKSYEIGTKWDLFNGGLALTLAGFQTETKNARATAENGVVAFIGERRIRGIELGFNGSITPEWSVFGGYTYMDAVIKDGGITTTTAIDTVTGKSVTLFGPSVNTGTRFPNTPKHSFTAFTNYNVTPRFTLGGGAIYMGKVYGGIGEIGARTITNGVLVIPERTLSRMAPSYWRFDANASYKITDNIQAQVNVQNVGNKMYYDKVFTAHYASQAAGRTAIFTLNVKY